MCSNREVFEQSVRDKWSDSFPFTRDVDGDYVEEVLQGMWWGWQAHAQSVDQEEEPDLAWDYDNGDYGSGNLASIISNKADELGPKQSSVMRVVCAQKLPDRWIKVTLSEHGDKVDWIWVDVPEGSGV